MSQQPSLSPPHRVPHVRAAIKLLAEALLVLLGHHADALSWACCRRAMRGEEFIAQLLTTEPAQLSPATVAMLSQSYMPSLRPVRSLSHRGPRARGVRSGAGVSLARAT